MALSSLFVWELKASSFFFNKQFFISGQLAVFIKQLSNFMGFWNISISVTIEIFFADDAILKPPPLPLLEVTIFFLASFCRIALVKGFARFSFFASSEVVNIFSLSLLMYKEVQFNMCRYLSFPAVATFHYWTHGQYWILDISQTDTFL